MLYYPNRVVANFVVATLQCCYGTKLLWRKVANFEVATATKWFKVPSHIINHRKFAKNSEKSYFGAKKSFSWLAIVVNAITRYKVHSNKVPYYMGNHRKSSKNSEKSSSKLARICSPTAGSQMQSLGFCEYLHHCKNLSWENVIAYPNLT